jgi:predicted amino acid-binding ACT domain protein
VLNHLLISQTAFKRDIDDPKTILDIAETVQSPERLRLLLVLTVADMRAVGPKVWNGWKATLLRELYWRVAEVLAGGLSVPERDTRVARARAAAAALLDGWAKADVERFLSLGYPGYWLSFDPETHARHAAMIREAEREAAPLTVRSRVIETRSVTEVTVYCSDHPGLFSRIAGALAVAGASIVDARIHTMTNGMALDTFWVQDAAGGAFDAPHRLARLAVLIEQSLSGRLRLEAEIGKLRREPARLRAVTIPPRVVVDNHVSNTFTVIEVNGRDRPGLLHAVTTAISGQGPADRQRPHHHLWRAGGGRLLRQGRVRPEGGERAQAGRAAQRIAGGARRAGPAAGGRHPHRVTRRCHPHRVTSRRRPPPLDRPRGPSAACRPWCTSFMKPVQVAGQPRSVVLPAHLRQRGLRRVTAQPAAIRHALAGHRQDEPQCATTSVVDQSSSAAISPRNSAARASTWSAGSSCAGHHTSSMCRKSSSGHSARSAVQGLPTSQVKA